MKVYTCTDFKGLYPTGAAAVVVADNEEDAKVMLLTELSNMGLKQDDKDITLTQIKTRRPQVVILYDGNY